jgi:hypothetical protein
MIKIAKNELYQGINLSRNFYDCRNSHTCLWQTRSSLFTGPLPRGCPKENCPVIIFRKKFEGDSPCYYAEALRLSQWWCVSSLASIAKWRKAEKRELERRVYNLDVYGRLVVLAIHPLDLAATEIPFLKPEEIKTLKKNWSPEEMERTKRTICETNPDWLGFIESATRKFTCFQTYYDAVFYLIYLFLKGLEKNQLPNLGDREEKEKFFSEIERHLHV